MFTTNNQQHFIGDKMNIQKAKEKNSDILNISAEQNTNGLQDEGS
mgnify:CR=1 FL=1